MKTIQAERYDATQGQQQQQQQHLYSYARNTFPGHGLPLAVQKQTTLAVVPAVMFLHVLSLSAASVFVKNFQLW